MTHIFPTAVLGPNPVMAASTRQCGSIYRGFAQCLLTLGDSMTNSVQREENTAEIDTICSSHQNSDRPPPPPISNSEHLIKNVMGMSFTPVRARFWRDAQKRAAAVWDSLRQESKKMEFSGNLYDMCATPGPAQSPPCTAHPAKLRPIRSP
ncbi:hypothetical protein SKAU_G00343410 [Synaphobranchus kaupii]|uniref:Uncharacterized protein n=1 Tax=Synaphobranchus kaupii TaxID=118154 RepID=A0A9Q1EJ53_SYNKA|nr:hypothetical protein SKAU_G00343410 [Synaphobranchus kaupii]